MPNNGRSKPRKCPLCGQTRQTEYQPFCSQGCRDRDLLNWFGEGYRVPVTQPPDGTLDEDNFTDE